MPMRKIADRITPWTAFNLIRLIHGTLRVRYNGDELIRRWTAEGKHYIIAFWHGRLLMMPYSYPGDKISILISRHRDGELIARTMSYFGYHSTRGSTTRGGSMGLRGLLRRAREGFDLAFTPDGPRGPRYRVQPGVVLAARMTGLPIVPVSFGAEKKKFFRVGTGSFCRRLSHGPCSRTVSP